VMSERNTIVAVKFIALMRRRAHMTHEQFVEYHRNSHAKTTTPPSAPTNTSSSTCPTPPNSEILLAVENPVWNPTN
jgi:hypothetical protein